jgi:hypothetical protein
MLLMRTKSLDESLTENQKTESKDKYVNQFISHAIHEDNVSQ